LEAAAAAKKEAEAAYKSGKTAPESDFSVQLNDAGDGCIISGYTGPGGNVIIPASIQGLPVLMISGSLFMTAFPPSVKSVVIPKGVTRIGRYTFFRSNKLESIFIPEGVTTIGDSAFRECTSLASVNIPGSVTTIDERAFADCTSLASVSIPEGVKEIGQGAFTECSSLKSLSIPDSITEIGPYAFSGCKSLVTVTVSPVEGRELHIRNNAFFGCPKLDLASQSALKKAGYKEGF